MFPPHIEYQTPHVEIKVVLPCNMSFEGKPLSCPLPQESEIRDAMIGFAEKIADLYVEEEGHGLS